MGNVKDTNKQLSDFQWFSEQVDSGITIVQFMKENPQYSRASIRGWETKHGLKFKRGYREERWSNYHKELAKADGPHRFFDVIDTPDKAYILGLIVSDGNIHEGKLSITLKLDDAALVAAVHKAIGGGKLHIRKDVAHFEYWNAYLCNRLADLGVHPNKSFTATLPNVPKELLPHLLRGLWDGDGYIKKDGGRVSSYVTASNSLYESIVALVEEYTGHKPNVGKQVNTLRIHLTTKHWSFMSYMYDREGLVMSRKKERFVASLRKKGEK